MVVLLFCAVTLAVSGRSGVESLRSGSLPPAASDPARYRGIFQAAPLLAAVLGGSITLVLFALALQAKPASATTCTGEQVYSSSQDLAAFADARPAGTTFCIADSRSSYEIDERIAVEDGDRFVGVYADGTRVGIKTSAADHIFYTGGADNAYISGLRVQGAVHDDSCEPECGRGIGGGGKNLTVEDVRASHNENQGIGGVGPGLVVRDSEFDNNGSEDAAMDGGKVSAAGIKSVNSMRIYNSYFHDNYWDGVWCDIECGRFEVHDSVFLRNGKAGIHYEISSGPALFEGNTIQHNGGAPQASLTRNGGILIVGSSNVVAHGNTFGGNYDDSGVEVARDSRTGYVADNVRVHDNQLNGDTLKGYPPNEGRCVHLWILTVCSDPYGLSLPGVFGDQALVTPLLRLPTNGASNSPPRKRCHLLRRTL